MTIINLRFRTTAGTVNPNNVPLEFGSALTSGQARIQAVSYKPVLRITTELVYGDTNARILLSSYKPALVIHATYETNTSRPTVHDSDTPWEEADPLRTTTDILWEQVDNLTSEHNLNYESALRTFKTTEIVWAHFDNLQSIAEPQWDKADHANYLTDVPWRHFINTQTYTAIPWDVADRTFTYFGDSWFYLVPAKTATVIPWGTGIYASTRTDIPWGSGIYRAQSWYIPWEEGDYLSSNFDFKTDGVVIPPEPPILPVVADLNFQCKLRGVPDYRNIILNFGLLPCPDEGIDPLPGETTIPTKGVYFVVNQASLVRADTGEEIQIFDANVSIDRTSWAWSFNGTIGFSELSKIDPIPDGPVEVILGINGSHWNLIIEDYTQSRTFGETTYTIRGRSPSAYLDKPYFAVQSYTYADDITSRQLVDQELARFTAGAGFDLSWLLGDEVGWLIPGGSFSYTNQTPIQVINTLAAGSGGYINTHRQLRRLIVKPDYEFPWWEWLDHAPTYTVPESFILSKSMSYTVKPLYNAVFVAGEKTGIQAKVGIGITAKDFLAPTFTSPFITDQIPARYKGTSILSEGGMQAQVSIQMPIMSSVGVMEPGVLISVTNGGVGTEPSWIGMIRGTAIRAQVSQDTLEVTQSLDIERHFGSIE